MRMLEGKTVTWPLLKIGVQVEIGMLNCLTNNDIIMVLCIVWTSCTGTNYQNLACQELQIFSNFGPQMAFEPINQKDGQPQLKNNPTFEPL